VIVILPTDLPAAAAAPLEPPAIVRPGPRQASFGRITVRLGAGTERVGVLVNGVEKLDRSVSKRLVRLSVSLPVGDSSIRVIAHDADGGAKSDSVSPVFGLPYASRPDTMIPRLDPVLQRRLRRRAAAFPGITGFYVVNLRTGRGAAWNARARFPAASTVKLAIAIEVLRRQARIPRPGSYLARLLRRMLVFSSNRAANGLLEWLGGTQSAGAARVTSTLRRVGLVDTYLAGGYVIGTASGAGRPIPLNVVAQPSFTGKYTSAWDLARLHRYLVRATQSRGPLVRRVRGFSSAEARAILYHLCHSADNGKLDRYLRGPDVAVPHKAGWITTARHDAGVVFWRGGSFVAAVMTWNGNGVSTRADIFAGEMARAAYRRYRALGAAGRQTAAERLPYA
jgi:beta-lactamase class A